MQKLNRLDELDILRSIALIFVVEQHVMGGYSNISYSYYQIFKLMFTICKPAVAIFVCISAISLVYKYSNHINVKKYYISRFKYIFLPYFFWSTVYIFQSNGETDLKNILTQVLAGNASYHLWYMGMSLRIFIYFPIILFFINRIDKSNLLVKSLILFVGFVTYYFVSKYQNTISDNIINFIFNNPSKTEERIVNISPLFWFFYFLIGIYISQNYKKFKEIVIKYKLTIIGIYIILLSYSYLNEVDKIHFNRMLSLMYYIFSIFIWYIVANVLCVHAKITKLLKCVSKYSYASYLIHIMVINYISYTLTVHFLIKDCMIVGFTTWLLCVLITTILIKIISFIPYTKFITGIKYR